MLSAGLDIMAENEWQIAFGKSLDRMADAVDDIKKVASDIDRRVAHIEGADIGARLAQLTAKFDTEFRDLKRDTDARFAIVHKRIEGISETANQNKGKWGLLSGLMGGSAIGGGLITSIANHLFGKG